jgi:hypothetical protein
VSKLILGIWRRQPGKFFCVSTKSGDGKWKDTFFAPDEFGTIKDFLRDNDDKDVYFCPHGFNRRVRQKGEAVLPNLLWADLDFADPRKLDKALKPTIAIESSPGRFVGLWVLKDQMNEALNRRLTYAIDADHGGWDVTQVLRMPGTRNFKYSSQPKVRVLWEDGKKFSVKKLDGILPKDDAETEQGEVLSAAEVWEKYEDKLPRWARRELLAKRVTGRVDRSEMLWKLENVCVEAGMSLDEAFAVIKRSVWNKFAGRRGEDHQLRRELEKVVHNQFTEKPKGADKRHRKSDEEESREEKEAKGRFKFRPMIEIERENLDFLWYPYFARGEITIIEGDPGLGKSYLAQVACGSIAKGKKLPCSQKGRGRGKGSIVYFDIENSAGSVTKPRLEDNGYGDLDNFYAVEEAFSIDDEDALDEIYEHLEEIKPSVVVFDTINTYIGKADSHKAAEVTQAMGIFKDIARQFNCSVVVLRHLTKGSGSAIYRGQGSIAFSGAARVVMSVGVDPNDTETRAVAITKINFAKPPRALTFRIEERPKGKSAFIWGEFVDLTSQEIMDAASEARAEGRVGTGIQDAMEFLEAELKGHTLDAAKLKRMAEKRSISPKMLERASAKMGIEKKVTGKGLSKSETWTLADDD